MADETYDPSQYAAAEVTQYLATAEPTEFARVKAAEAAGKDRATVRDFQQSADQAVEGPDGYTRVVVAT